MDHENFHQTSSSRLIEKHKGHAEVADTVDEHASLAPITDFPPKLSSTYKTLFDFSQEILPDLRALLRSADTICPEQCKQAIAAMKMLIGVLEKQKAVLRTPPMALHESDECTILRCKLDVALTYAGELTQKLIRLFSAFQTRCCSQSKQAARSREEIVYYLTLLSHHYDSLLPKMREMNMLQDQLRFRHKRLKPSIEGKVSLQG